MLQDRREQRPQRLYQSRLPRRRPAFLPRCELRIRVHVLHVSQDSCFSSLAICIIFHLLITRSIIASFYSVIAIVVEEAYGSLKELFPTYRGNQAVSMTRFPRISVTVSWNPRHYVGIYIDLLQLLPEELFSFWVF